MRRTRKVVCSRLTARLMSLEKVMAGMPLFKKVAKYNIRGNKMLHSYIKIWHPYTKSVDDISTPPDETVQYHICAL